ncbi:MAG: S1 RNA-binding domain-containing protein, partial [Anaerolineae bacterium]
MDAVQTVTQVVAQVEAPGAPEEMPGDVEDTQAHADEAPVEVPEGAIADVPEAASTDAPEEALAEVLEVAPADAPEEALAEVPEEPPAEAPEEALAEVPEEPPVEAPEEALAEVPEEPPAEAPEEALAEVSEEPPAEIPAAAEEEAGVVDAQDAGLPAQAQVDAFDRGDMSEMGELPVEDWDYQRPKRGEVRDGIILAIQEQEIIVDVGAKRDGIVPYADLQRMGPESLAELSVGDEVPVFIMRPEDQDGNLLVSLFLARQAQSWTKAQGMFDSGEILEREAIGYNKGGLVVPVGDIRGFVPASQIPGFPLGLGQEERLTRLSTLVGETLQVKVIEINRRKRRLILSATAAQQEWRQKQRERLLSELREGEVRKGVVSSLCSFGAFVDLGGADGLVHLSELSWKRIRHPRESVRVGQEVEVYVLRLDVEKKRIGLSLKRLLPEPWALVEDKYELGQLVEGVVTNVVDFGAFAEVEDGVEGLVHVSELTEASISHPRDVVKKGDLLLLRIIRIDTRRKRLGLSLKRVLESEWAEWAARLAVAEAEKEAKAGKAEKPRAALAVEEAAAVEEAVAEAEAAAEAEALEEAVAEAEAVIEAAEAAAVEESATEEEAVAEAEVVIEAAEEVETAAEEAALAAEEAVSAAEVAAAEGVVEAELVEEAAAEAAAEAVVEAEAVIEAAETEAAEAVVEAELVEEAAAEAAAEAVVEAE